MTEHAPGWRFHIDRGGTFTDVVARDPTGRLHLRKLLSEDPARYRDAPLHAMRELLGLAPDSPIPTARVAEVAMGTTVATNALLERQGEPAGLLVTRGFADLLAIATQDRPAIFALDIRKPAPIAAAVEEVHARVRVDGTVEQPLDEALARRALARLRDRGLRSVAVVLLHAWAHPEHELRLGQLAQEAGFEHISLSHRVAREIKAVGRGDTTLVDASLTPVIRAYVDRVRAALGSTPLWFAQSSGGLAPAGRFSGKDAVLSGPAGGVVACATIARRSGIEAVIGFDMGGTSTDVSRWAGRYERVYEKRVAGVRIKAPMLHIETVAAGGGSILSYDGQRYTVGPRSAGADPGPACYRRGGPPTVTDANLVLGRVQPRWFPACFGPEGDAPIDPAAARARLEALRTDELGIEEVAAGCIRIANAHMVAAIEEISVARGHDPADHALICFGGAGAQHACAIAEALGLRRILVPPMAGALSAWGIGLAEALHSGVRPVLTPWDATGEARCEGHWAQLEAEGRTALMAEDFPSDRVRSERRVELRYQGVDATLDIAWGQRLRARFEAAHQQRYGFLQPMHPIELVNLRVETRGRAHGGEALPRASAETPRLLRPDQAEATVTTWFDRLTEDGQRQLAPRWTPVWERADLQPGDRLEGPALVVEDSATTVVDPGWTARLDGWGQLLLEAAAPAADREAVGTRCDPVLLEIFGRLFTSIADQMGSTLELAAHSVNIKERLDFSCAIFDAGGELVANAHHIPVHLGAMGASVQALLRDAGDRMEPGDAWASNDPFHGGSHLPDVTVVSPVFLGQPRPAFFVASRGHHADIGGVSPGSMPPDATRLEQEGVVIHALRVVRAGVLEEADIHRALSHGPWPARDLAERMSDLRAQVAANQAGRRQLEALAARYGWPTVQAYMGHVRDQAAAAMRRLIARLPDGVHRFEDHLDCGARIACSVRVQGDRCTVDFTGTDPQLPGNLNAPPAVTQAAVIYAFRALVDEPVPLNAGCMAPITLRLPPGSLLDPAPGAAVAGGNVETSSRICDVVLGALGALAACQGTMNNLNFGTEGWGYYETICGGAGAGPGFHGAHAVHTHMTNTRITDPEVLEHRYPVLLEGFCIRRGSGGAGRWRGGDGAVRTLRFLAPMELTMLSERRRQGPFGLQGGEPGAAGRNTLIRADGERTELPGAFRAQVQPGDRLVVETPGGGGFGCPHAVP
jgi:5-oxoprolinase (ATP-hydrolysing)